MRSLLLSIITPFVLGFTSAQLSAQDFNPVGLDPERAPCLNLGTEQFFTLLMQNTGGYFQRIDRSEFRGWAWAEGPDPIANPQGVHRVTGVKLLLRDSGTKDPSDRIVLNGRSDDGSGNLPSTTALPFVANIPSPFMDPPGSPETRETIVSFATASELSADQNYYWGVAFLSSAPIGQGPSILGVHASPGGCLSPPGPAPIANDNYVLRAILVPPSFTVFQYTTESAQLCLELYSENLGAKAISWPLPFLPDQTLYAGYHPDALNPPSQPGRADDIGFQVMGQSLDTDDLVFFFRGRAWAPTPYPWRLFFPGAGGALTIDPFQAISALGVDRADSSGVAFLQRTLSPAFRASTSFLDVYWIGIAVDEVTGEWQISPASKQVLGVPPEGWR